MPLTAGRVKEKASDDLLDVALTIVELVSDLDNVDYVASESGPHHW